MILCSQDEWDRSILSVVSAALDATFDQRLLGCGRPLWVQELLMQQLREPKRRLHMGFDR